MEIRREARPGMTSQRAPRSATTKPGHGDTPQHHRNYSAGVTRFAMQELLPGEFDAADLRLKRIWIAVEESP